MEDLVFLIPLVIGFALVVFTKSSRRLSKYTRRVLISVLMFALGDHLGQIMAPRLITWFAAAQLIRLTSAEILNPHGQAGFGWGLLFAAAGLAGRSLLGCLGCLCLGLVAGAAAAYFYRAGYASAGIPMVADHELPMLRIPLIGAAVILGFAWVRRLIAARFAVVAVPP